MPVEKEETLLELFKDLPIQKIGTVIQEPNLKIRLPIRPAVLPTASVDVSIAELVRAWNNPLQ